MNKGHGWGGQRKKSRTKESEKMFKRERILRFGFEKKGCDLIEMLITVLCVRYHMKYRVEDCST